MLRKEDIELIERVSIKAQKKLLESIESSALCEHLKILTRKDIQTLFVIGNKGRITMGDIAEEMGVTISTPTTAVDRLIKKNYAERRVGEEDRRQVLVSLTTKGQELYQQLLQLRLQNMELLNRTLSEEEMEIFRTILKKLDQQL